jgi:hypothetical protein
MTMVGLVRAHALNEPASQAPKLRAAVLDATHDYMDKGLQVDVDDLRKYPKFYSKKEAFGDKNVFLLMRDPRDQLVSAWLHGQKNKRYKFLKDMHLSTFIRHPQHGMEKLAEFHEIWWDEKNVPKSCVPIWYEDMLLRPTSILKMVMNGIAQPFSDADIEYAVRTATLEQLQEWERTGYLRQGVAKPRNPGSLDSYYHRKGKVGDHVNHMTQEDIEHCNQVMECMTWWNARKYR